MLLSRALLIGSFLIASLSASRADDKDIVARIFHTDPQYVVMNIPPRPNVWPGAVFSFNMRLPIEYGNENDPAVQKGPMVAIDADSGFDIGAKASGSLFSLYRGAAQAGDAVKIVMSFPDARISDMSQSNLQQKITSSNNILDALKLGQAPIVVIKTYSGTPTITITRKTGASAEVWAKIKADVEAGGKTAISNDSKITYKGGENFVFAFETMQVSVEPNSINTNNIKIKLASLPENIYSFREAAFQRQVAESAAIAAGLPANDLARNSAVLQAMKSLEFRQQMGINF